MAYSANILPKDAAYYVLQNASISNGVLSFLPGGSLYLNIDKTFLTVIPPSILLNFYTDTVLDSLNPEVTITLNIVMADETVQNFVVYPSSTLESNVRLELPLTDGDYSAFQFIIHSEVKCDFILWELCPEQETDVAIIIEGVEQSLPHVLYDYNEWSLQVAQDEVVIGMIACDLLGNTDVNGHFTLDFYSSEYCNVYIRFKDNEITELYTPMIFTVNPGQNTIGIPHSYLKRLAGLHNFVVTCQCTNGILDIYPRGLLYTIDAGYLAERLINAGLDIMDVTIRQLDIDNGPDELWCIGIDAGEILVKSRAYKTQANTAWTPRYSLGRGIAAAIEFEGDWVLASNNTNYTLKTQEQPYMFVVDLDGNLSCYTFNGEILESVLVDTDVESVSAIRGYKSSLYVEQDQGLIVAYVKSNNMAYYRQYMYNSVAGIFVWDNPVFIDAGVQHLVVNRLNDYRVSFTIEYVSHNQLLVSDRTYVAQSIKPEYVDLFADSPRHLFNMDPTLEVTTGTSTDIESTVGVNTFEIVYDRELKDYFSQGDYYSGVKLLQQQMTVTCDRTEDIQVTKVQILGNKLIITVDKLLLGVVTIDIPVDNYIYLNSGINTKQGKFISGQIFTVNVMRTFRVFENEACILQLTAQTNIYPKEIITTRKSVIENCVMQLNNTITNIYPKEVTTINNDDGIESAKLNFSMTGSITVTSTGTSPI